MNYKSMDFPGILAGASPFFARKFEGWTPDEAKTAEVLFADGEVSYSSLGEVIDILYERTIDLSDENVYELHETSNYLDMDPLAKKCLDFIKGRAACLERVVPIWMYSQGEFPGAKELEAVCLGFIVNNLSAISAGNGFLNLMDWTYVSQIAKSPQMAQKVIANQILDFLLSWINHNWTARFKHVGSAVALVDWTKVDYVTVRDIPSVKMLQERKCESGVEKLAEYRILKKLARSPTPPHLQARSNTDTVAEGECIDVYCIRKTKNGSSYLCKCYDSEKRFWTNETRLVYPVENQQFNILAAFKTQKQPCLLIKSGENTLTVHKFEHRRILEPFAKLVVPKKWLDLSEPIIGACGENGWICIVTVKAGQSPRLFAYKLTSVTMEAGEEDVRQLPPYVVRDDRVGFAGREGFSLAVVGDTMIMFGGRQSAGGKYRRETRLLNLTRKEWSDGPDMPYLLDSPACAVRGDVLYVAGGLLDAAAMTSVYRLEVVRNDNSLTTGTWTYLAPLMFPRFDHRLVVVGGPAGARQLIAFGGKAAKPNGAQVTDGECLDLTERDSTWTAQEDFLNLRAEFALVL